MRENSTEDHFKGEQQHELGLVKAVRFAMQLSPAGYDGRYMQSIITNMREIHKD